MFLNVSEYKKIVKEKRELLENQCNSATSHPEYKQYVSNYRVYHLELLNSIKKVITNTKLVCAIATIGIWASLAGCAHCGVLTHTIVHFLYLPLSFILLYVCYIADKELAELICVYEKEV